MLQQPEVLFIIIKKHLHIFGLFYSAFILSARMPWQIFIEKIQSAVINSYEKKKKKTGWQQNVRRGRNDFRHKNNINRPMHLYVFVPMFQIYSFYNVHLQYAHNNPYNIYSWYGQAFVSRIWSSITYICSSFRKQLSVLFHSASNNRLAFIEMRMGSRLVVCKEKASLNFNY